MQDLINIPPMKYHIHSPQDPSVGMEPLSATVEIPGIKPGTEHDRFCRMCLYDCFSSMFDDGRVTVQSEEELNADVA